MKKTPNSVELTAGQIAEKIGAKLEGDRSIVIDSAAPIDVAGKSQISFVANSLYHKYLSDTNAGAIILDEQTSCPDRTVLRHPNPYLAFARALDLLYPDEIELITGINPTAVVEDNAQISQSAAVGPLCHIQKGASVGDNCRLLSSVFVGRNVSIGENCLLYPGVRIMDDCTIGSDVIIHSSTVIGSDGFGYAPSKEGIKKVKQVGWVEIDNNVEIGSNVSIDRGALGATRIGSGTKIDNLVQIAHNVQIGKNCFIVSQVGISGSTKIGDNVILAGQVGVVGHIDIGDGVTVGAQSGVSKSVPAGKTIFGCPARDIMTTKRIEASLIRLPDLLKRVKKLEQKLKDESGD